MKTLCLLHTLCPVPDLYLEEKEDAVGAYGAGDAPKSSHHEEAHSVLLSDNSRTCRFHARHQPMSHSESPIKRSPL